MPTPASGAALRAAGVARWLSMLGAGGSPVDPGPNSLEFVTRLRLVIDGRPFDWETYSHLRDLYEDDHPEVVVMAGAQSGKSVYLMSRLLRSGLAAWGGILGYYFPDYHLPRAFSTKRFRPFVASHPELSALLGAPTVLGEGTDAVLCRTIGPTAFYFLSVKGKTSTEGLPMRGVFFDEVRRMSYGDIQRAEERTSAQRDPVKLKVSTALFPESDIHAAFNAGDQRYFHSDCGCADGTVLSLTFPDCVADLRQATPKFRRQVETAFEAAGRPYLALTDRERERWPEACYVCPKCGTVLTDPRDGWWEAHNPGAYVHSYQLPQLLSPLWPAGRILAAWAEPEVPLDLQEFYNSKLGLPYIAEDARRLGEADLAACVDPALPWFANQGDAWRRRHARNCAMGVDAQAGYNVCVLKRPDAAGKYQTVHLEILHGEDPWKAMAVVMQRYDVSCAVIDCLPHWNEAHRFARAFEGRVWLAIYNTDLKTPMIDWKDRGRFPPGQKGEERFKWMVHLNKVKALQWSLSRWRDRQNTVPDPRGLIQHLPRQGERVILSSGLRQGRFAPVPICRDVYFDHLQRVVFVKSYPTSDHERRGEFVLKAEHVGLDPHFAHANLYADVACSRLPRARLRGP